MARETTYANLSDVMAQEAAANGMRVSLFATRYALREAAIKKFRSMKADQLGIDFSCDKCDTRMSECDGLRREDFRLVQGSVYCGTCVSPEDPDQLSGKRDREEEEGEDDPEWIETKRAKQKEEEEDGRVLALMANAAKEHREVSLDESCIKVGEHVRSGALPDHMNYVLRLEVDRRTMLKKMMGRLRDLYLELQTPYAIAINALNEADSDFHDEHPHAINPDYELEVLAMIRMIKDQSEGLVRIGNYAITNMRYLEDADRIRVFPVCDVGASDNCHEGEEPMKEEAFVRCANQNCQYNTCKGCFDQLFSATREKVCPGCRSVFVYHIGPHAEVVVRKREEAEFKHYTDNE